MLSAFVITDILIAIVSFILYGRARMKEKEQKEKLFLRVHSISLFVLLITGIVYMYCMVEMQT